LGDMKTMAILCGSASNGSGSNSSGNNSNNDNSNNDGNYNNKQIIIFYY